MTQIINLTKRNIHLYFKNKGTIIYSMLAILILIGLHFLFIRSLTADGMTAFYQGLSGTSMEKKFFLWFSDSQMFASIIPIASFTISLVALGQIVSDKEQKVIEDFFVSPIKRSSLLFSYLLSSILISIVILFGFLLLFEIYFLALYGISFSLLQFICLFGLAILSTLLANVFLLSILSFIKKEQTMGAIGTILGTMLGFLCGAYVPIGQLGSGLGTVFTFLPFLPLTALCKQTFIMNLSATPLNKEFISGDFLEYFGFEMSIGNTIVPTVFLFLIVLVYITLFSVLLIHVFKKMRVKN